ncbi:MAG: hypothetical protein ABR509_06085, partial [Candidatus Limnocylindria bacterium]
MDASSAETVAAYADPASRGELDLHAPHRARHGYYRTIARLPACSRRGCKVRIAQIAVAQREVDGIRVDSALPGVLLFGSIWVEMTDTRELWYERP